MIPYQILTDKNLRDKEKIIYSLILFFSNNKGYCSIRNKYLEDLFDRSTKRISSIINTLQKNYKKYNIISNYEGREYEPEFLETLYANYSISSKMELM